MQIAALDIEATSLSSESWPMEVGACILDNGEIIDCYSSLIRPDDDWTEPCSQQAFDLHGIKRESLSKAPDSIDIAKNINNLLKGHEVYIDGNTHDRFWLMRLFQNKPMSFTLKKEIHIPHLILGEMRAQTIMQHRALPDAIWLARSIETIIKENTS